jgi:hypothetical protein
MAEKARILALSDRLRQLDREEELFREKRENLYAQLIELVRPGAPEDGAGHRHDVETVRRVGWRAIPGRQRAMVTIDGDPVELPLRLALVVFALVKLGHGAGGDALAYRSASEIATWMADHRSNGVRPSLHSVESYVSKLRRWPDGRLAPLIEGDKNRGWRIAIRTAITVDGEP